MCFHRRTGYRSREKTTGSQNFNQGHVIRSLNELCDFNWTYVGRPPVLDAISTGITLELHQKHGPQPIVAFISEIHPYVLATLFATWKLGGVFAPLDSTESVIQNIVKGTFFLFYLFCQPLMGTFY